MKFYTIFEGIPKKYIPSIVEYNSSYTYTDSVELCDFVLLPHWEVLFEYTPQHFINHSFDPAIQKTVVAAAEHLVDLAKQYNKPVLVVNFSDITVNVPFANAITLQTSINKSKQKENMFALPAWKGDFQVDFMGNVPNIRKKGTMPKVGFRGSARPLHFTLEDSVRTAIGFTNATLKKLNISYKLPHEWNQGQILRKQVAQTLMRNKNIESDITILTRGYINQNDTQKKDENRKLFINNIINNDYNICLRGAGNYSYRFYETISAGRIPLFINTDCALPYDFIIDWKKYCVWVEAADVDRVDQILLDFHHSLTDDDFAQLQIDIRKLWEEWICKESFFNKFDYHIAHVKQKQALDQHTYKNVVSM